MLAHAAQVQHHHLQPQRLPMGQQHGLTVNPHFRQSGSMGVPQQQPRYSHHLQQQQGGGKVRGSRGKGRGRGGARGGARGREGQGEGRGKGRGVCKGRGRGGARGGGGQGQGEGKGKGREGAR